MDCKTITASAPLSIIVQNFLFRYGFGNWKEIKDNLEFHNCKFTEFEIESHYHSSYLTDQSFMPVMNILYPEIH